MDREMADPVHKPKYPRFQEPKKNSTQPKKKKNAPDRPQPAWLFPPDEENPVLNPKPKSDEKLQRETELRNKSLDYMKRRVHGAPDRPAPPHLLLTLVGAFLTENGFNSTSRLFTNERKARQVLNGWQDNLGQQLEKGMPSLETIFKESYHKWQIARADETSSSGSAQASSSEGSTSSSDDSDSDDSIGSVSKQPARKGPNASDSVTSESDSSDGKTGVKITTGKKKYKIKSKSASKTASSSSSSASSSSSSDTDADDELEPESSISHELAAATKSVNPTLPVLRASELSSTVSKKRKASSSSSDGTSSSDSSTDGKHLTKKSKSSTSASRETTTKSRRDRTSKSSLNAEEETSSSGSESSSSESDTEGHAPTSAIENHQESSVSSSSATISGDTKLPAKSSSSSLSSSSSGTSPDSSSDDSRLSKKALAAAPTPQNIKEHQGAKSTPLAEASAAGMAASHPSNAYQSYNYADRAYQDLSVTRGKGFTKEKNKKKRGSYRGGTIDTAAGKGFKFSD